MPELPEVETVRKGIEPAVRGRQVRSVRVGNRRLREPVPEDLPRMLRGQRIGGVRRRGKYLVFSCGRGDLIVHLGMSGTLRVCDPGLATLPHDHVTIVLSGGKALVFNDPRRFGLVLWSEDADSHRLIRGLGIEPLSPRFTAKALAALAAGRDAPVKSLLMNSRVVAGIGNIYANEALFGARIDPFRPASSLGAEECSRLARAIRRSLRAALRAGGSTLRDFVDQDGRPGLFQLRHHVYDRAGERCRVCGGTVRVSRQQQRSTYHCPRCQR